MPAKTPRIAINRLLTALHDHDLEAAVALYEEDATLVCYPGMLGKGIPAIRTFLEGLFSLNAEVRYDEKIFTEAGDLALFTAKWTLLNSAPTPLPMPRSHYLAHIALLRRQPDGNWLIAIDNPWGPELPPTGGAQALS